MEVMEPWSALGWRHKIRAGDNASLENKNLPAGSKCYRVFFFFFLNIGNEMAVLVATSA